MRHPYNFSTQETEWRWWVQGQPGMHNELEAAWAAWQDSVSQNQSQLGVAAHQGNGECSLTGTGLLCRVMRVLWNEIMEIIVESHEYTKHHWTVLYKAVLLFWKEPCCNIWRTKCWEHSPVGRGQKEEWLSDSSLTRAEGVSGGTGSHAARSRQVSFPI